MESHIAESCALPSASSAAFAFKYIFFGPTALRFNIPAFWGTSSTVQESLRHSLAIHSAPRVAPSPAPMTMMFELFASPSSFLISRKDLAAAMSLTRFG